MSFTGLGIDEVGHHGACVAPPEDVGQRTVTPEHTLEMEAHQQDDAGVHESVGFGGIGLTEHVPVRQ